VGILPAIREKNTRAGCPHYGVALLSLLLAGCVQQKQARPPVQDPGTSPLTAPITNTDACATAMHDICGAFLLFYASQNRLPAQLSELYSSDFLSRDVRFVCPVGQQPYIYNPGGIFLQDQNALVILYDATPAHSQHRWAISIQEPHPGQPLVAKVIALPEQFFLLQR
jgi:hypothetical protein